ncbi:non-ribosomal peptide synthetase [Clostridium beijerinckii]|uniref:non-ribosomal peptide synthetase n=1 Tax=Clostridium beijerinckii TaxID=1520 RepID=UPI00098C277B|nr:non-ribosomal peptide synthetase [Clostridium beijerinckii]NRT80594.1 acyl-CoA synthetase (AMP-forming)/AMP-acid ligase II [Clostridium beijerinckii]OOM47515.1 polyketide synthase PksJ [Clostridium beijerinckii]
MHEENLIESFISNKDNNRNGITVILSEDEEKFIPYSQLYESACKYLEVFQKTGVCNELLYQVEDIEKFLYIFWACQLGGITAVPIDIGENDENNLKIFRIWNVLNKPYYLTDEENLRRLSNYSDSKYSKIITELKDKFISVDISNCTGKNVKINDYKNNDYIALIQFSSGSTGIPKGIPIKYTSLYKHVNALVEREEITEKDVALNWAPLSHNLGLVSVHLVCTSIGISQYIMSKKLFVKNPMIWIDKATEHKATMLYSPNFGFRYFLKCEPVYQHKKWDLSNVRIVFNGAEPINYELCNEFLNVMKKYNLAQNVIYPAYGCSESTSVISIPKVGSPLKVYKVNRRKIDIGEKVELLEDNHNGEYINLLSCGYVVENCEIRVCDEKNEILNDFYVGNLQVRGVNVIEGYYNNEEATQKSFYEEGWFNTGDLCFMDKGNVVITGRSKEVIFINGQNYYPYDIERIIEEVDERLLGNIAVCGVFNEELQTDEICMFIECDKGTEISAFWGLVENIKVHISKKMGLHLSQIIPVEKLEKTDSGKLQRLKLGNNYKKGVYDELIEAFYPLENKEICENDSNSIENNVLSIWRKVLGDKELGVDDNFFELGGSSNLLIVLNNEIDKIYKGKVSGIDIFEAPTVRELSELIRSRTENNDDKQLKGNIYSHIFLCKKSGNKKEYELIKKEIKELKNIVNYNEAEELLIAVYSKFVSKIVEENKVEIAVLNNNENRVINVSLESDDSKEIEDIVKDIEKQIKENSEIGIDNFNNMEEVVTVFSLGEKINANDVNADIIIYLDKEDFSISFNVNIEKIKIDVFSKFIDKFISLLPYINEEYIFI